MINPSEVQSLEISGRDTFCLGNQYTAVFTPDDTHAALEDVIWTVRGDATIDENGVLTPGETLEKGDKVVITATSAIRRGIKATKTVTYWYDLESIAITGPDTFFGPKTYSVKYSPGSTPADEKGVTWSCVGKATIDSNGTLTANADIAIGEQVTITATSKVKDTIVATKTVTYDTSLESIAITGPDVIGPWKTGSFGVSYAPATIDNVEKGIVWNCSDNAEIDQNGKLTLKAGIQDGDTITVTATSALKDTISATKTVTYDESLTPVWQITSGRWTQNYRNTGYFSNLKSAPNSVESFTANNVYQSNSIAGAQTTTCTLTVSGYSTFVLKFASDAERGCDYTTVSISGTPVDASGSTSSRSTQMAWQTVTWSGMDPSKTYTVTVTYQKDFSGSVNPDCGYFYVDEANCK